MISIGEIVRVENKEYKIIELLGRGKGGYSYLGVSDDKEYVIKQIHHEPCSYYSFGNKIEAELNDYKKIRTAGVRIPIMISFDRDKEIIVKEYIDGTVLSDLIKNKSDVSLYLKQMREMLVYVYNAGLNIDYYPTNFVVNKKDNLIYYIDYECNLYDPRWDFDNWGIKYWNGEEPLN